MRHFVIALFFFFSIPAFADQLIIEPEMGREPIISALNNAKQTIDLVMYGFTDTDILNALIRKHSQTNVKVILEDKPYKHDDENIKTINTLRTNNIAQQGAIAPFRLIHQKTLLIDGKKAYVMTFNFTHSTFKNERNFALVIDDAKKVNAIAAVFSADWNHKPVVTSSPELIYSPDGSRDKLIALIESAHDHIQLYAQSVSDYKIIGALAKTARSGVNIDILTSNKLSDKQTNYLRRAGVSIHISKHLYIHAKAMIIDNKLAVIGSTNLTRSSLEDNRELSVVTYDKNVIKQLTDTFNRDWNETKQARSHRNHNINQRVLIHAMKALSKFIRSNTMIN
jgi:cardiolipin synthase